MCEWKCKRCGTTDKELQYPSGKMNKCKDCQRWYNITVNSKRKRKYKKGPELNMTEEEFLKWCRSQERKCDYVVSRNKTYKPKDSYHLLDYPYTAWYR